jgi:hypothetical protein
VGEINNSSVYAIAGVKTVYRTLDPAYRAQECVALMSYDTFDLLNDDIAAKQQYTVTDPAIVTAGQNAVYVPGTGRKLLAVACEFMGASERIIVTPKSNVILGCDLLSDANQINTNTNLWTIEMGLLFNVGVNFALMDAVAYNDRD